MIAKVKYQVATYKGTLSITCNDNEDDEFIIARAKSLLQRQTAPFPFGYQSWKVVSRE